MAISSFNLSDLTGSNGFTINGVAPFDTSGYSVRDAGDINKDGIGDIVIGAPGFTRIEPDPTTTPGTSYVVFGSQAGFPANFELSTLNGTNGFALNGVAADDFAGLSVSGAGDVNGDGKDDLIIGAIGADPNGLIDAGSSYVVFGSASGFAPSIDLATLNGINGFTINGIAAGDELGRSVSAAGDINGDGLDDVIIGAVSANPNGLEKAGQSYVVFGSNKGFSTSLNVSDLDGNNGFTINPIAAGDELGVSVSAAGDVNGDGIDDLIIGAYGADPNGESKAGQSYVVFGSQAGFAPSLNLSALDGTNGFAIDGIAEGDYSSQVSAAGDINGDGIDDLIIGAYGADPNGNANAGTSYVVFGSPEAFPASFKPSGLDGTNGFAINGIAGGNYSGFRVSSAGDFNGDGIDDLIISAPFANTVAGQSYLVFGSKEGFSASINLSSLDGINGSVLNGVNPNNYSGISVSGAGDINGDGVDDLIIGATYADPNGNTNSGSSYVVFGKVPTLGTEGKDVLNGTSGDDALYGRGGNDTITGGEGVNTLLGEDGNDRIDGGSQTDYINGGKGNDEIYAGGGNNTSYGGAGNDLIYSGSGDDLIVGGPGNDRIFLRGGKDIVVLQINNGVDRIDNFQVGQTTLGLSGGLTFENLAIAQTGNDTLIKFANTGENLARLNGVQASSIGSSSFVNV
ncbi:FG-GAP repeat protein [Microcoleus vaginatus GB1-A2]|uniref:FG-GAP repeat protein n=1 Tax=Microcoleus vaginatus TaxID=119532 RepID=UPI001688691A|nr:FG-GAP repeat protein [Microcoleus sp. FACHB-61]